MLVAVLGASDNPARYAHVAVQRLRAAHHDVIGVNPRLPDLGEVSVVKSVGELPTGVHTLTVYLAPERSELLARDLLALPVKRVIFNPGSEHPDLQRRLTEQGTRVVEACTLVLLATGRFDEE
jgi:predicted CoA-binding protein